MLTITATGRSIRCVSNDVITTGSVGIPAVFNLSEDFDGLSPVAVFCGGGNSIDVALITRETVVPHEALTKAGGALEIGVYARNSQGTIVIPTVWVSAGVIREGTKPSGVDPSQPTPDWTAQVQAAASEAVAKANEAKEIAEAAEEAAITGAESAAASAAAAAQSATDAQTALEAAQLAADAADTFADDAETSKTAAALSASVAAQAKTSAETAAQAAATSATSAAQSATAAAQAKADAETAAANAATSEASAAASAAVAQELIDKIPNIEGEINTLSGAVDTLGGTVSDLSGEVDGLGDDVSDLQAAQPKTVTVTGTTPVITAVDNTRYVCGEVSTLDITLPANGIVDVVFSSGTTPTVLTVTPPTGVTLKWAGGFDPESLDADTTYEINICDGLGVAASWT